MLQAGVAVGLVKLGQVRGLCSLMYASHDVDAWAGLVTANGQGSGTATEIEEPCQIWF